MKPIRNRLYTSVQKFTGIVMISILAMLFSCENDIQTINSLSFVDSLPSEFALDIEVYYSDSGKIQAYLESPYMMKVDGDEPYMEFPDGFKVIFYDSVMNEQSVITAKYGINYEKKQIMEARDNVVVINVNKDEQLETEHLVWDRRKGEIFSEVFIKITRPGEVLYGDGLTSDQSFDSYQIKNPTGEFNVYPDDE